jgi:hypothetical protein
VGGAENKMVSKIFSKLAPIYFDLVIPSLLFGHLQLRIVINLFDVLPGMLLIKRKIGFS